MKYIVLNLYSFTFEICVIDIIIIYILILRKRSEEESTGRMEWVEKNVRSDLR